MCCCLTASLAGARATHSQSYSHPPKVDFDEESEQYSEFWEQILTADDAGVGSYIAHARVLWTSGGSQERKQALRQLHLALESKADSHEALFWLGHFHYEVRKWSECADALTRVYALEPGFVVIDDKHQDSDLQENLASCLLYSGQYEPAIDHYKRLLAQRPASSEINLHLGEALMATGRLQEAIDALYIAQEQSVRSAARIAYAVALDRAERIAESKSILHREVNRSPDLKALHSSEKVFAPAEDEHYYLGLAYGELNKRARALFHFRRYLALAPASAWAKRASAHRDALGTPELAERITAEGSADWNREELRTAIRRQSDALRSCLAGQPMVLATIRLSGVIGGDNSRAEVHAKIEAQVDTEPSQLEDTVACLESAARKIRVPRLSGSQGSHASAEFSILGDS